MIAITKENEWQSINEAASPNRYSLIGLVSAEYI
jgi:hypothetical protein